MSKEDLKVKPAEQDVKEEDLKEVNGGFECPGFCPFFCPTQCGPNWGC